MEIDISRLKGISRARYELEVVTPLFMGGADPKFAEIRAQSIKGLLRFWWRAHQKETDIKKLREKENRIFGSTDGKSRFSISVECGDKPQMSNLNKGATFAVEGRGGNLGILDYLSFGICVRNNELRKNEYIRQHFPSGTKFEVNLAFYEESVKGEVLKAFALLVAYGGLGAKSRNGFGSLRLLKGELPDVSAIKEEHDLLSYPSFSQMSQRITFREHRSWENALSEIGLAYRRMRLSRVIGVRKHDFIKRQYLARPIIEKGREAVSGRLAKQFHLHVSKNKNNTYQGQILVMPYRVHVGNDDAAYRLIMTDACRLLNDIKSGKNPDTIY